MPKVIIRERSDRSGPVKLTLGSLHKTIPRNKEVNLSQEEVEVLLNSHEANHVFVYPEVTNGGTDRTERPDTDPGRDETGAGPHGKLRRTG